MQPLEPIDAYVRELKRELRMPRNARRRVLREVRAHLLDAAEAERCDLRDARTAAQRAVARFGPAVETASQFNRLPRRRVALLRRALVPWVAAAALTSTASATVWAFQPGAGRAHASGASDVRASEVPRARHPIEIPRARPAGDVGAHAGTHHPRTR